MVNLFLNDLYSHEPQNTAEYGQGYYQ